MIDTVIKICKTHGKCEHKLYKRKGRPDYNKQCIYCKTERRNKSRRELKQKAIEYKGGCCSICGYNKCNSALDFHHTGSETKDLDISRYSSWELIKPELDKCILVCRNCHSKLHYKNNFINPTCNKERVANRRRELKRLSILYKGGGCAICGHSENNATFDFHHLDPNEKEFGIGEDGITRSFERLIPELNKTILLCRNCHSEYHSGLIFDLYYLTNYSFEIKDSKI